MYTSQSSPTQPFTPWSGPPGWQDFNNIGYGAPSQTYGNNGYSTTENPVAAGQGNQYTNQQDYVPFDNGKESYKNGNNEERYNDSNLRPSGHNQSIARKPSADAVEHMAQLRAKLKAQQRPKSATPTPTRNNKMPDNLNHDKARADDKSFNASQSSAPVPATSNADIEGLFAEVKAGMRTGRLPSETETSGEDRSRGTGSKLPTAATSKTKAINNDQQQSFLGAKTPSSEASELGEIREGPPEPVPAPKALEPVSAKSDRVPATNADKNQKANGKVAQSAKNAPSKIAVSNGPPSKSNNTTSPANARVDAQGVAQQTGSKNANNDRYPMRRASQSIDLQRPTDKYQTYRPRSNEDHGRRQTHGSRDYPNGSEQTATDQHRRYTDSDQQPPRSADLGINSAAVQPARSTETGRREAHAGDPDARPAPNADNADKITLAPQTPITKSFNRIQAPNSKDATDIPTSNAASEPVLVPPQEATDRLQPSMFTNKQMYEDISDWLEITQWNDVPARTKKLARHRKLKALDIQRAELEQEAQQELEEQSRSIRARSTLPAEPGILRNVFSPHVLSTVPGTNMAPPAPPLRITQDMGIKIKDMANSEVQVTGGITEMKQR